MPLQKLQFRPGINRESTTYANEGGWYESEKVRFRSGFPEKIGGWVNLAVSFASGSVSTFKGVAREMWNWMTLAFSNLNAVGTNQKFYIESGGAYNDVTPKASTAAITLGNNPFTTTSGSRLITVTHATHGASAGTWVTFAGAATFNGVTVSGEYEILSVPGTGSYTIAYSADASGTGSGGGAAVTAWYDISAGGATYTTGNGWGAGGWGGVTPGGSNTGWGAAATIGVGSQLRLWSADNYGEDLIFAPRDGAIYYWETPASAGSFPAAITLQKAADTAGYNTIVYGSYEQWEYVPNSTYQIISSDTQRFVIAFGANPYDPTSPTTTFDPMLVRWSDQENLYLWVPDITNQSGEYRLTTGSFIVAARFARQEILIWTDIALFSMQYLGPPYVWGFTLLTDNLSVISPNAMASVNNVTYWMGVDKFYMYSGRVETLPCTLRQYIFSDLNQSQAYQIQCGTNEGYNEVWWFYPSANSTINDRYVIYNHLERIWYHGSLQRTAWLDSSLRQYPMGAFSVQNSYLAAALTDSATSLTLLNGSAYPTTGTLIIDSEQITYTGRTDATFTGCVRGANNTTAASHAAYTPVTYKVPNQVMYHEDGVDDYSLPAPQPIEAYVQSSDFDIGDGHNFGFVWRMLPDLTFDGSTVNTPSVTLTVRPRQNSGTAYGVADTPSVISANNYALARSYNVQRFTGQVYTRIRGRQMAFKIESTGLGTAWQLGTPRLDVRPDGRR